MPSNLISRRYLRAASALTLVLGAGLAVPAALAPAAVAAAPSATAEVNSYGWQLTYTAAAGQTNKPTVKESLVKGSTEVTYVIDDVVPISAGGGCVHPVGTDRTKVVCTVSGVDSQDPYAALEMRLGDGNDTVSINNTTGQIFLFNSIDLGPGNDKLTGNSGIDGNHVSGQAGNDTITVGKYGTILGGDGADTLSASGGDNIVQGGKGNDVIRGAAGAQSLSGDDGNDSLYGGNGNDSLYGGKGNDILYGNSGADVLYGNTGDDKLYGGAGKDTLSGGAGKNVVRQD
ncbi:calcium-binding protein [Streptomyces sp. SID1121]|uniref:calcium-binding protein n=1 Tax=Streptomyces sp. SID1121 TaxID=3425888 RepID=UPI004056A55A